MTYLDACLYCPGSLPRNKRQAKRLRDTRQNRARELSLFDYLTRTYGTTIEGRGKRR